MKLTTKKMSYCALFAALTAICSQIAIPLPMDVPLNLATFAVMLAGAALGGPGGAFSQLVYVLLGAVGAPVFAMFRGGFDRIAGPTGGYIIGYIFMALLVGVLVERWGDRFWKIALAMTLGTAVCYLFGTAWYMISSGVGLFLALTACVFPFLPGDVVKIILSAVCANRLRAVFQRIS